MKYPKSIETMPTIFMMACGATQGAGEGIFPPLPTHSSDLEEPMKDTTTDNSKKNKTGVHSQKNRFALLIGINNYGEIGNLMGCINDVNDMKDKLLEMGWNLNNIKILIDEKATKNEILQGLKWLVSHCNTEDSLFFHFSGYGSWTLTPEGLGWECCICAYDCCEDWDNGVITRTEFNNSLERPSGFLHVTLDSCFSAGMSSTYRSWKQLPQEVRNLLYGEPNEERIPKGVRALPGPEWETVSSVCNRLIISQQKLFALISEGSIESRKVKGGPRHVRVKDTTQL